MGTNCNCCGEWVEETIECRICGCDTCEDCINDDYICDECIDEQMQELFKENE